MTNNSTQPAPDAMVPPPSPVATGLIVFGRDVKGKAHASHFEPAQAAPAEKAAALMKMRVLPLATDELRALGAKVPLGRTFTSGLGFVPYCSDKVFGQLDTTPGAFTPERPIDAEVQPRAPGRLKGGRLAQSVTPGQLTR